MENIKLDVRVFPIENPQHSTLAFASVGIADMFAIRGIRVVDGDRGLFVSMPQNRGKDDKYHDVAFPLTKEFREELNKAILDTYAAEKTADRGKSIGERMSDAAEKVAAQNTAAKPTPAKKREAEIA
jgi:stage V sporulation protein G